MLYLKLRENKAPYSWDTYDYSTANCFDNVGIKLEQPYIVVDIDDMIQAEKLTRLIEGEGIKSRIMQTTKGRHFWFKVSEPLKNSVRTCTGIGLMADYRSWGKNAQVCVKLKGKWRKWINDIPFEELDELPRWLRPLRQSKWRFWEMGEGDGRNAALFEYQLELSKRGYSHPEATQVLTLINRYILKEPLPNDELATVCRDEAYPKPTLSDPEAPWFSGKTFLHNIMGDILMDELQIISLHDQLYVYRDGCYRPGENTILRAIVQKYPEAKRTQQNEVINYLNIQQHIEDPIPDEYVINCLNGRLDLKTGQLLPHSPDALDFQQINATYSPSTYYEPLDHMLLRVFCNDYQLYKLFEELLGYCLIKNCRMQKIFIFFGEGNNGKSTLLRVITSFIGAGNYTTLSLQDLEKTFRPAELENRLVNLGDDIPYTTIKDSSLLKSISSGENVLVERKNKDPFILRNYATLIYTTNKMPRVNDKSYGFYRRLILIPLDATFSTTDPDYDPDISQKVVSDEARSYLLNMAVRGLRRLLKHGFTVSGKVQKAIETYRQKSSTTLSWIAENNLMVNNLVGKTTAQVYSDFRIWCDTEGVENIPKQRTFTDELKNEFNLTLSEPKRDKKTGKLSRLFEKI